MYNVTIETRPKTVNLKDTNTIKKSQIKTR